MTQQFLITINCDKQTAPEDIAEILGSSTCQGFFDNSLTVEVEEVTKINTVFQDPFESAFYNKIDGKFDGNKFIKKMGEILDPNKNQEELKCI